MPTRDERQRAQMLKGQPYTEGTWKIGNDWFRVTASLYPSITWWIEPFDAGGKNSIGPRRQMTADEGSKLEAWL